MTSCCGSGLLLRVCNLYRMKGRLEEVADLFCVFVPLGANFSGEVYPGYPGLVVPEGAARPMIWGFPLRLKTVKPTSKPSCQQRLRRQTDDADVAHKLREAALSEPDHAVG